MDDAPDKPEEAAASAAPIISVSAVPCNTGGQLILNGSSSFLAASQPLLLNGNSLISGAGAGVIINGLNLGDCRTVTLSPVATNSPLILNGAQVLTKPGVSGQQPPPQLTASGAEQEVSVVAGKVLSTSNMPAPQTIVSPPLHIKPENDSHMDFIIVPKSEGSGEAVPPSSSSSSSSPTLSSPTSLSSIVLTQTPQHQAFLTPPASLSSAGKVFSTPAVTLSGQHTTCVVSVTSGCQLNSPSSVISCSGSAPHAISLPQVVPSIQGAPVSHLVQQPSGAQVSQCPQLVPVSPLPSPAPHFQPTQTLNTSNAPAQPQLGASTSSCQGATTIVSISQLPSSNLQQQMMHQLGEQTSSPPPSKIQAVSISSATQVVPAPQAKGSTAAHPLSLPQLVPVSSSQTPSNISFPQVVPASSSLSIPAARMPLQILTSAPAAGGVAPSPLRINQLRPIQSVGTPTSMAPPVQLLNPGIIQLPSAPPGTQITSCFIFSLKIIINVF